MKAHLVEAKKDLYIRIPDNIDDYSILMLEMLKACAGKTIKISTIDNKDAPFEKNAIVAESDSGKLVFEGDEEYWEPEDYSRTVVEGNPDCDYSECTGDCHVVSCPVHQGMASGAPKRIGYIRSSMVK